MIVDPIPVIRDGDPPRAGRSVVSIGVFDGVHVGHRAILERAKHEARALGLPLVAMTFEPHPMAVLRPESAPTALAGVHHRIRLLAEVGVDAVRLVRFTAAVANLSPREFSEEYLRGQLSVATVVVGSNFRFGHRAAGDVSVLAELGRAFAFGVKPLALVSDPSDRAWSSTAIRRMITEGDVVGAAAGLGRAHRLEGRVVHGDHRGMRLGYPTANLAVLPNSTIPADGVYAARLEVAPYGIDPVSYPAAVSVGANVVFGGTERRVEAHVLDRRDLDLYGEDVAVDFVDRLRPMRDFDSADALAAAMNRDVSLARSALYPAGERTG